MGNEIVNCQLTQDNLIDELRNILSCLPSSKGSTFPLSTGDKLEGSSGDFLASGGHTDDAALTETSMGRFKSSPHHTDIASAVISVVDTPLFFG